MEDVLSHHLCETMHEGYTLCTPCADGDRCKRDFVRNDNMRVVNKFRRVLEYIVDLRVQSE